MDITSLVQTVEDGINNLPFPKFDLPPWLIFCVSKRRTGLSAGRAISNIYAWMKSAGIPTGNNPDGSPNLVTGLSAAITQSIMDEICENGYITGTVSPGGIMIQATGGNAGGPVTVVGQNINFPSISGILR